MSFLGNTVYELTPFQKGILVYNQPTTDYITQNVIDIKGQIDSLAIKKAFHLLAQTHNVLLTKFVYDENHVLMQKIDRNEQIEFELIDLVDKENEDREVYDVLEKDLEKGFVLSENILFRAKLILLDETNSKLLLTYHHLILDNTSLYIIYRNLINYYEEFMTSKACKVNRTADFSSYVEWINKKDNSKELVYWKEQLANYSDVSELIPANITQSSNSSIGVEGLSFDKNYSDELRNLSNKLNVSIESVLKTAWAKLLSLHNRSNDIVFGTVSPGREADVAGIENMAGVFINTLPLRVQFMPKNTIQDVILKVESIEKENRKNAHCSLAQILTSTNQKKELFKTIFMYEDHTEDSLFKRGESGSTYSLNFVNRHTSFDISVSASLFFEELKVQLFYNPQLYSKEYIQQILEQFQRIVREIVRKSTQLFETMNYLSSYEEKRIFTSFNRKRSIENNSKNTIGIFEEQVRNHGDKIALIFEKEELTYKELNERANQLAWKLIREGVTKGDKVALVSAKSIEMIIGFFGILKVGGVYVPIDSEYPKERINYMLADCQPKLIITYRTTIDSELSKFDLEVDNISKESKKNPDFTVLGSDLAYIIYTSGTTGEPKGVMVEHKGIVNLGAYFKKEYKITSDDNVLQFANLVFDASIWEISMALLNGATLVILPNSIKEDMHRLSQFFLEKKISVATLPPNYFLQTDNLRLRLLVTAGSSSSQSVIDKVNGIEYINAYGPTETTVCATDWKCTSDENNYRVIPIGTPIDNVEVYIMVHEKLAGILVPGELCVGGVGVARGYLNKEKLTKEKFIKNPFSSGMLYRTGDLARWLTDGSIEFMGRIDSQIKIRGFRVELEEIETVLRGFPSIKDVAVTTQYENEFICAYIVTDINLDEMKVKRELRDKLPEYMIPSYFFLVDSILVNQNGKVDVSQLPQFSVRKKTEYIAPRTRKETVLCDTLRQVIGIDSVGIQDYFSALGGDSIKAIRLVSYLRSRKYGISIKKIMQLDLVELIANEMRELLEIDDEEQKMIVGEIKKTPIIVEFEQWNLEKPHHFNQDVLLSIDIKEVQFIKEVIDSIVLHHDLLRAVYRNDHLLLQEICNEEQNNLFSYDLSKYEDDKNEMYKICTDIHESFNFKSGILFKAALFELKNETFLFLCAHHLIIDGVSWRIIIEDILTAIEQKQQDKKIEFPSKTVSFKTWSEIVEEYKNSSKILPQLEYWKGISNQISKIKPLSIISNTSNKIDNSSFGVVKDHLDRNTTDNLVKNVSEHSQLTMYELLVASLVLSFEKYDNQNSFVLMLESHGREELHKKVSIDRTVGWFTSIYPAIISHKKNIKDTIINSKETLRNIPNNGFEYGLLKDKLPKFDGSIYFNYLGKIDMEGNRSVFFNTSGRRNAKENGMIGNINISVVIIKSSLLIEIKYRNNWIDESKAKELLNLFKVNIEKVADFCQKQTKSLRSPSDYSAKHLSVADFEEIDRVSQNLGEIQDIFSLTPIQEGLLFENEKDDKLSKYTIQQVIKIRDFANEKFIQQALSLCILHYEALRTNYIYKGLAKPRQVILRNRELSYEVIDLSEFTSEEKKRKFKTLLKKDVEKGFNLERDELFRVKYVHFGNGKAKMILCFHHIIMDGWSQSILFNGFVEYYNKLADGISFNVIKKTIHVNQYKLSNYIGYLKQNEKVDQNDGLGYWKQLVGDSDNITEIRPLAKPKASSKQVMEKSISVSKEISNRLIELSISKGITLNTVIETIVGIVLQKYNATEEVIFGKVTSGRNIENINTEDMVGLFINTIPVKVVSKRNLVISDLLKEVQRQGIDSLAYTNNSLAEIQNQSKLKNNLFNVLLVFENHIEEERDTQEKAHLSFELIKTKEQTNYPITILSRYSNGVIQFNILYDPNQYCQEDILLFSNRLLKISSELTLNLDRPVEELSMLSEEEETMIETVFNQTWHEIPAEKTIIELFEKQVQLQPNNIFAEYDDHTITYHQFNQRVNQIARKLRKLGIKPNDFVAISSERSIEMLIGIYAIIKSGGAYVPIAPTYPQKRVDYILEDCFPKAIILYKSKINSKLPYIDLENENSYLESSEDISLVNTPNDNLYLIYTSGTTGLPKGVVNHHIGIVNVLHWMSKKYEITNEDSILFKTAQMFDVSLSEIFMPIFIGAKIVIAAENLEKDPKGLLNLIKSKKITLINFVPSMLEIFLQFTKVNEYIQSLRYIFSAGETLSPFLIQTFNEYADEKKLNTLLINLYGPTETSIFATHRTCSGDSTTDIIGKPIGNTEIFILNGDELCGIGIFGELCIAGEGVAKGYLNQKQLTNKKFVSSNYTTGKIYRSGDLARWLPDGNLEYLGRIDNQVKIRGFRVELNEIENCIKQLGIFKGVAIVVNKKLADSRIVAYVVSEETIDCAYVRSELTKKLADYMIPNQIIQINELPLTQNGKLDKNALLTTALPKNYSQMKPTTKLEKQIYEYYKNILQVEDFGIDSNFFELGGHSLNVMKLYNQLTSSVNEEITITDLFKLPTVRELAGYLLENKQVEVSQLPQVSEVELYPMSPAQKRIYIVSKLEQSGKLYNMPLSYRLPVEIDSSRILSTLKQLTERHEILRTVFMVKDDGFYQKILSSGEVDYTFKKDTTSSDQTLMNKFADSFDLEKGPLFRTKLIKRKKGFLLLVDMHHIISDGVSFDLFLKEFSTIYNGLELIPVNSQYSQYSEWFKKLDLNNHRDYWINTIGEDVPVLALPYDYTRPKELSHQGKLIRSTISKKALSFIARLSKLTGATEYMILMAALMVLLNKYSLQEEIIVGAPISGRIHKDTESMLGVFINMIPIKGKIRSDNCFKDLVEAIQKYTIEAYAHQAYPFEQLVDKLNIERDVSRNPLFDVVLNYHDNNQFELMIGNEVIRPVEQESVYSKFDLDFTVMNSHDGCSITLEFCTDLFSQDSANRILANYIVLLERLSNDYEKEIGLVNCITIEEKEAIDRFNCKKVDNLENLLPIDFIEKNVEMYPDKLAIISGEERLTYRQLEQKGNVIASKLVNLGVQKNDFVAVMIERGIDWLVAVYGVLKAGAAYVPIDLEYPTERINYILKDCKPKVVLVNGNEGILKENYLDLRRPDFWNEEITQVERNTEPGDIIYCIYTSGTTGIPKGVLVEQRSVVNLCMNNIKNIMTENKVEYLALTASFAFDSSIKMYFTSLMDGKTLHIISDRMKNDTHELVDYLIQNKVGAIDFTPSYLRVFQSEVISNKKKIDLKVILSGGEELMPQDLQLMEELSELQIYNLYGPTEATVDTTIYRCLGNEKERIAIGSPIININIHVMNEESECGIGFPGELCISGEGLARGYLNQPLLNEKKFTEHPHTGERMYHSGDLARWKVDGNIEFLGRIDDQVKLRGYRIEMNEINNTMKELFLLKDSAVVMKTDRVGSKSLYGFVVVNSKINSQKMKEKLSLRLPKFMIPDHIIQLDVIPTTVNGKVDKKALLMYKHMPKKSKSEHKPYTPVQHLLCQIFSEILQEDQISIDDNFFELGGDSIKAILIVSRLKKLGYVLSVRDIMSHYRIESLAPFVKKEEVMSYSQEEVTGTVKTTPILQDFINRKLTSPQHFCQDVLITVEQVTVKELHRIFDTLMSQHDLLRSVYRNDQLIIRKQSDSKCYDLFVVALDNINNQSIIKEECTKVQNSFDLENGPLVKLILFNHEASNQLFICIHHLVIDGVSWKILLDDLKEALDQIKRDADISLPAKTTSYLDWSEELDRFKATEQFKAEAEYWKQAELESIKHRLTILKSKKSNRVKFGKLYFNLNENYTELLYKKANRAYNTKSSDLLITALTMALSKVFKQDKIALFIEGHGREEVFEKVDIGRTIGWFTSKYPVVLTKYEDIGKTISVIKDTLHRVKSNGFGYGLVTNYKHKKEKEIFFNYLGEIGNDLNFCKTGQSIADENGFLGAIDINAMLLENKLVIEIAFDEMLLEKESMRLFAEQYKAFLNEIIMHCHMVSKPVLTASDYKAEDLTLEELDKINKFYGENEVKEIYPLTSLQNGMFYHKISDQKSKQYIVQLIFDVKEELNPTILRQTLQLLIRRYSILRTAFFHESIGEPKQIVLDNREVILKEIDLGDDSSDKTETYSKILNNEIDQNFNLKSDSLIRFLYITLSNNQNKLVLTHHHIVLDGWCIPILKKDIENFYFDIKRGLEFSSQVEKHKIDPFLEYSLFIKEQNTDKAKKYWKNLLNDYEGNGTIKPLKIDTKKESVNKKIKITIPKQMSTSISNKLSSLNVTTSILFETAWGFLLSKYNYSTDEVFGKVVSGRNVDISNIHEAVGPFVNTIPVRINYDGSMKVSSLLKSVADQGIESLSYSTLSLVDIQKETRMKNQLVKVLYVFENYYVSYDNGGDSEEFLNLEAAVEETNYELTLSVFYDQGSEEFLVSLSYDESIYDKHEAEKLLYLYKLLLYSFTEQSNDMLENIDIITESDLTLINSINETNEEIPKDRSIMEIFEEQVEKMPNSKAICYEGQFLTYKELNYLINQFTHRLRSEGVAKNDLVMIVAEKSLETIISICSILKLGGAYIPVDSNYPDERIQYMINDAKPSAVLVKDRVLKTAVQIIKIDGILERNEYLENPIIDYDSESLAYIMYTSGTTGVPKGSLISHKNIIRLVKSHNLVDLNEETVILQTGSIAFDASTFEIWGTLLNGGTLILADDKIISDSEKLKHYINDYSVNTMWMTAPLYNQLIQNEPALFNSLNYLLIGGDQLSVKHVRLLQEVNTQTTLINGYGPTEGTTFTTMYKIPKNFQKIYIGKPIANTQVYIMNGKNLCGVGMIGQLCIAGEGVSRGYLNQQSLTRNQFINNPFGKGKLYLSGDLARLTSDGAIDFIGRNDSQIKIRGYRIEPREVEELMNANSDIQDVCVLPNENSGGEKELHAYFTAAGNLSIDAVRNELRAKMPEYMIPTLMKQVKNIPLTIQGKVDKNSLPRIEKISGNEYKAPYTEAEKYLCRMFEEVLSVETIGLKDNFYTLGGDSIKAIRIVSGMRSVGYEISVKDVMTFYIVELIAQVAIEMTELSHYEQGEVFGVVKSTPIIENFSKWNFKKAGHFNQDVLLEIDATNTEELIRAFDALVIHHDILRAVYYEEVLTIKKSTQNQGYDFFEYEISEEPSQLINICNEIQATIDLGMGPLMKVALFKMKERKLLFICIHHLIVDTVSWQILLDDLKSALNSINEKREIVFSPKTASYIDWANALSRYKLSEDITKQKGYWKNITEEMPEGQLRLDKLGEDFGYQTIEIGLNKLETAYLTHEASLAFNTKINDLTIAALGMAIRNLTNQEKLSIVIEGHGREEVSEKIDITNTVGWFTCMYPIVILLTDEMDDMIINTKERIRKVPNNGIGYSVIQNEYPMKNVDITFNYLGDMGKTDENKVEYFSTGNSIALENTSISGVHIIIKIIDGCLNININFNQSEYSYDQIRTLSNEYLNDLKLLIDFCMQKSENSKTISDVDTDDLLLEDLENINSLF